jgi:hypothetical protein
MWSLILYIEGERIEIFLDDIFQLRKILKFFPRSTEVQIFRFGSQYTNELLGFSYSQIVTKFSHIALYGIIDDEIKKGD